MSGSGADKPETKKVRESFKKDLQVMKSDIGDKVLELKARREDLNTAYNKGLEDARREFSKAIDALFHSL